MDAVKVVISNDQKAVKIPTGIRMLIRRCCHAVLELENFEGSAEVSVRFVDNEQIRELNKQYRNIDKETDVLSFHAYVQPQDRRFHGHILKDEALSGLLKIRFLFEEDDYTFQPAQLP